MTKPKYQIDDRITGSPFYVRGVFTPSDNRHRYFLQVAHSDNTFVVAEEEIEDAIAIIEEKVKLRYPKHFKQSI